MSIISAETLKKLFLGEGRLEPPDYVLVDFQYNLVPMLGVGKFQITSRAPWTY